MTANAVFCGDAIRTQMFVVTKAEARCQQPLPQTLPYQKRSCYYAHSACASTVISQQFASLNLELSIPGLFNILFQCDLVADFEPNSQTIFIVTPYGNLTDRLDRFLYLFEHLVQLNNNLFLLISGSQNDTSHASDAVSRLSCVCRKRIATVREKRFRQKILLFWNM